VSLFVIFPGQALAGGSASENYSVPTCIFSGGGRQMGSSAWQSNGTVGQTSPAAAAEEPRLASLSSTSSTGYVLYPGFWFTLEAFVECDLLEVFAGGFGQVAGGPAYSYGCDGDGDGDIDGQDLAAFADRLLTK